MVYMKVIPHYQFITLILNILNNILCTIMAAGVLVLAKVVAVKGAF